MNPIDELRAARPAHLGDTPLDERTRAAELAYAMARPRERRRRAVARPVWGLGLAGAAAALTAAAVVVVNGTGGAGAPPPTSAAAPPASSAPRTVRLPARAILLAAAEKAADQPEATAAYWHTVSVSRSVYTVEDGGYQVVDRQRHEMWTPRATGGEQWSSDQDLGAVPATDEDRAAWERAGSPSRITVQVPGKKLGPMTLSTSPGKPRTGHMPLVDGDKVFWLGRNVTMKDLRELPSDPDRLKAWLLRSYGGHSTESDEPMPSDTWLFQVSVGLISDMPVTPEVRAAAFRMLAGLDGVAVTEDVTDAEGRSGTAVALKEHVRVKDGSVLEQRLVFDAETGRALATESVVVEPGGLQAGLRPGTVWNSTAVLESGWTDTRG
ncbi:CU044_5270 family protein [Nonomuraea pusilla]|uniref:CU044_5270 family protein n=1 Tax=Nonomuraea pusilla TaxID=46177 RepID=UPI00332A67B9